MRLYSLYGDASDSLVGSLETGELARKALADAESVEAVPSMLCGDFNLTFAQLPCLHALVASNWSDLGGGPTCAPSHGESRRIDLLIANPGARAMVSGKDLDWATGIPTHAAQFVHLTDQPAPSCPMWLPPKAIPPSLALLTPEQA